MIAELALVIMATVFCWTIIRRGDSLTNSSITGFMTGKPMSHDERVARLINLADRYYSEHKYIPAERAYLRILRLDHRNTHAYNRLGFIYTQLNNAPDALECFKIVADQKPSAAHYHNYAMALFKNREFRQAADVLIKANGIEKTQTRLISLARIYRILGEYDKQAATLEEALELQGGDSIEILHLLAETHLHNKDLVAAKAVFKRILKLEPDNMRARQVLSQPAQS
jgi:tetratricopeptide (TPR) repeat protein